MSYVTSADLAGTSVGQGATLVGFKQPAASATSRTVDEKLHEQFTPEDFGAIGDGLTDDSPAFAAAIDALNAIGGGVLKLGRKTYAVYTPIILDSGDYGKGLVLEGEGLATIVQQKSPDTPAVELGGSAVLRESALRRLVIKNESNSGHLIVVNSSGCTLFEMDHVILEQADPAGSLLYAPDGGIYDSHFHGGDWYMHPQSTQAGVYVRTHESSFNENIFENLRAYNAYGAPFFDIANAHLESWLVNNSFRNINFEICAGGGVKFANARGWTFQNISFWDCAEYTGHLIHAAANAGYQSCANNFVTVLRHGDHLAAGKCDIFLEGADFSLVTNCFTQLADQPRYDWNNKNVVVIGIMYGEQNVAGRTLIRGDQIVNYGSIFGGSLYGDTSLSVGGISSSEKCRISVAGGYVNFDALSSGLGHILSARDATGTVTKLVFSANGGSFWPLTNAKVDLGFSGQGFKDLYLSGGIKIDAVQVVGSQYNAIPDPAPGNERSALLEIIAAMRAHGLIAS